MASQPFCLNSHRLYLVKRIKGTHKVNNQTHFKKEVHAAASHSSMGPLQPKLAVEPSADSSSGMPNSGRWRRLKCLHLQYAQISACPMRTPVHLVRCSQHETWSQKWHLKSPGLPHPGAKRHGLWIKYEMLGLLTIKIILLGRSILSLAKWVILGNRTPEFGKVEMGKLKL